MKKKFKELKHNCRIWTIHCRHCLRILGITTENLQDKGSYCLSCSKKLLKEIENKKQTKISSRRIYR